ncbi:hypoxanthine phosphoribosyltransferase [Mesohalobacter salilacus]|uniref:hypoxanthine phosphoribosyltransferase n=1 Tax=Mesohalobacter salilacus TaxID=2491711 RepID=UPI0026C1BC62
MTIRDLQFELFITQDDINKRVEELAKSIQNDYKDKTPTFLIILNGAFMFASDLIKHYQGECRVSFMRLASYRGTRSTGNISTYLEAEQLENEDVIIVEDIVDTGNSIEYIIQHLKTKNPKSYRIASLFHKPDAYKKSYPIDYIGISIPDKFIVGYGLDYNGLGRNLPDVYQLKTS